MRKTTGSGLNSIALYKAVVKGNLRKIKSLPCRSQLSFAERLWQFFRFLVHGTLKHFRSSLASQADPTMQATDAVIAEFSITSLQLDAITMSLEHDDSLVTGDSDWLLNSETCGREKNQLTRQVISIFSAIPNN